MDLVKSAVIAAAAEKQDLGLVTVFVDECWCED